MEVTPVRTMANISPRTLRALDVFTARENTIVIKDEGILAYIEAHPTRRGIVRVLDELMS